MAYPMRSSSNFQRSQSKVWFGSSNLPLHTYYDDYFSLPAIPITTTKTPIRSTILEQNDESMCSPDSQNESNLSSKSVRDVWNNRQGSPSSHKSQDSGFSDTENSPNSINKNLSTSNSSDNQTPKKSASGNQSMFQRSPSTSSEMSTPPTVIRKVVKQPIYEEILSARRISFSAPSSPLSLHKEIEEANDLLAQIDSITFDNTSPLDSSQNASSSDESPRSSCKCNKSRAIRRSRVITKNSKVNRSMLGCMSNDTGESEDDLDCTVQNSECEGPPPYNNETVYFGGNRSMENELLEEKSLLQPPTPKKRPSTIYVEYFPVSTSTPTSGSNMRNSNQYASLPSTPVRADRKSRKVIENFYDVPEDQKFEKLLEEIALLLPSHNVYSNPLLNGHSSSVQNWIDELSRTCHSEVMSTLQSKSITAEASRNFSLTPTVAFNLIKKLQAKVHVLQTDFEKIEKLLASGNEEDYQIVLPLIQTLSGVILDFIVKQETQKHLYLENPKELTKFSDNLRSIREMAADLNMLASKIDVDDIEDSSLVEDVSILKRYFLISTRMLFEALVRIIVDSIEDTKCDMILRSNLSYVSTLSNYEYTGFASLIDAFVANGTVRVLLLVCMENKSTAVRALCLRALATVCSTFETVRQFELDGGLEIIRDILVDRKEERSEQELREAVSVLTQVTAPWQSKDSHLDGIKEVVEGIVESITQLIDSTSCCQTLLLCAACLNHLSRIEPTAIYSLMSNESILKLKSACDRRGPAASIFLFEQISSMIYNMSSNKKSHHHLSNKQIINFIIQIFQTKFYEQYNSRAELDAQSKTVKNVLHIFSRLIHESVVSQEVLENNVIPIFSRIERNLKENHEYKKDISCINRKFNESLTQRSGVFAGNVTINSSMTTTTGSGIYRNEIKRRSLISMDQNRQESYV